MYQVTFLTDIPITDNMQAGSGVLTQLQKVLCDIGKLCTHRALCTQSVVKKVTIIRWDFGYDKKITNILYLVYYFL